MYPLKTQEEYNTEWIEATYETMGWGRESELGWEVELDETGTKLVMKDKGILQ